MPEHNRRVFVPRVDAVCGVGRDRAEGLRYHDLRVVVTNRAVLDFRTPDGTMRLRSLHPGVTVDDLVALTGFPLVIEEITTTRAPTDEELRILREELR